jgi:hypothetical protein
MLVKKFFEGLTLFKLPIQTKRARLLKDADVIQLMRLAWLACSFGEDFETFLKSMK